MEWLLGQLLDVSLTLTGACALLFVLLLVFLVTRYHYRGRRLVWMAALSLGLAACILVLLLATNLASLRTSPWGRTLILVALLYAVSLAVQELSAAGLRGAMWMWRRQVQRDPTGRILRARPGHWFDNVSRLLARICDRLPGGRSQASTEESARTLEVEQQIADVWEQLHRQLKGLLGARSDHAQQILVTRIGDLLKSLTTTRDRLEGREQGDRMGEIDRGTREILERLRDFLVVKWLVSGDAAEGAVHWRRTLDGTLAQLVRVEESLGIATHERSGSLDDLQPGGSGLSRQRALLERVLALERDLLSGRMRDEAVQRRARCVIFLLVWTRPATDPVPWFDRLRPLLGESDAGRLLSEIEDALHRRGEPVSDSVRARIEMIRQGSVFAGEATALAPLADETARDLLRNEMVPTTRRLPRLPSPPRIVAPLTRSLSKLLGAALALLLISLAVASRMLGVTLVEWSGEGPAQAADFQPDLGIVAVARGEGGLHVVDCAGATHDAKSAGAGIRAATAVEDLGFLGTHKIALLATRGDRRGLGVMDFSPWLGLGESRTYIGLEGAPGLDARSLLHLAAAPGGYLFTQQSGGLALWSPDGGHWQERPAPPVGSLLAVGGNGGVTWFAGERAVVFGDRSGYHYSPQLDLTGYSSDPIVAIEIADAGTFLRRESGGLLRASADGSAVSGVLSGEGPGKGFDSGSLIASGFDSGSGTLWLAGKVEQRLGIWRYQTEGGRWTRVVETATAHAGVRPAWSGNRFVLAVEGGLLIATSREQESRLDAQLVGVSTPGGGGQPGQGVRPVAMDMDGNGNLLLLCQTADGNQRQVLGLDLEGLSLGGEHLSRTPILTARPAGMPAAPLTDGDLMDVDAHDGSLWYAAGQHGIYKDDPGHGLLRFPATMISGSILRVAVDDADVWTVDERGVVHEFVNGDPNHRRVHGGSLTQLPVAGCAISGRLMLGLRDGSVHEYDLARGFRQVYRADPESPVKTLLARGGSLLVQHADRSLVSITPGRRQGQLQRFENVSAFDATADNTFLALLQDGAVSIEKHGQTIYHRKIAPNTLGSLVDARIPDARTLILLDGTGARSYHSGAQSGSRAGRHWLPGETGRFVSDPHADQVLLHVGRSLLHYNGASWIERADNVVQADGDRVSVLTLHEDGEVWRGDGKGRAVKRVVGRASPAPLGILQSAAPRDAESFDLVTGDGDLVVYDGKHRTFLPEVLERNVQRLVYRPDGNLIFTKARTLRKSEGSQRRTGVMRVRDDGAGRVAFQVLSGEVRLWQPSILLAAAPPDESGDVFGVFARRVDGAERTLLLTESDGKSYIGEYDPWKRRHTRLVHGVSRRSQWVQDAASPLVHDPRSLRLWNLLSPSQPLAEQVLSVTAHGNKIAFVDADRRIHEVDLGSNVRDRIWGGWDRKPGREIHPTCSEEEEDASRIIGFDDGRVARYHSGTRSFETLAPAMYGAVLGLYLVDGECWSFHSEQILQRVFPTRGIVTDIAGVAEVQGRLFALGRSGDVREIGRSEARLARGSGSVPGGFWPGTPFPMTLRGDGPTALFAGDDLWRYDLKGRAWKRLSSDRQNPVRELVKDSAGTVFLREGKQLFSLQSDQLALVSGEQEIQDIGLLEGVLHAFRDDGALLFWSAGRLVVRQTAPPQEHGEALVEAWVGDGDDLYLAGSSLGLLKASWVAGQSEWSRLIDSQVPSTTVRRIIPDGDNPRLILDGVVVDSAGVVLQKTEDGFEDGKGQHFRFNQTSLKGALFRAASGELLAISDGSSVAWRKGLDPWQEFALPGTGLLGPTELAKLIFRLGDEWLDENMRVVPAVSPDEPRSTGGRDVWTWSLDQFEYRSKENGTTARLTWSDRLGGFLEELPGELFDFDGMHVRWTLGSGGRNAVARLDAGKVWLAGFEWNSPELETRWSGVKEWSKLGGLKATHEVGGPKTVAVDGRWVGFQDELAVGLHQGQVRTATRGQRDFRDRASENFEIEYAGRTLAHREGKLTFRVGADPAVSARLGRQGFLLDEWRGFGSYGNNLIVRTNDGDRTLVMDLSGNMVGIGTWSAPEIGLPSEQWDVGERLLAMDVIEAVRLHEGFLFTRDRRDRWHRADAGTPQGDRVWTQTDAPPDSESSDNIDPSVCREVSAGFYEWNQRDGAGVIGSRKTGAGFAMDFIEDFQPAEDGGWYLKSRAVGNGILHVDDAGAIVDLIDSPDLFESGSTHRWDREHYSIELSESRGVRLLRRSEGGTAELKPSSLQDRFTVDVIRAVDLDDGKVWLCSEGPCPGQTTDVKEMRSRQKLGEEEAVERFGWRWEPVGGSLFRRSDDVLLSALHEDRLSFDQIEDLRLDGEGSAFVAICSDGSVWRQGVDGGWPDPLLPGRGERPFFLGKPPNRGVLVGGGVGYRMGNHGKLEPLDQAALARCRAQESLFVHQPDQGFLLELDGSSLRGRWAGRDLTIDLRGRFLSDTGFRFDHDVVLDLETVGDDVRTLVRVGDQGQVIVRDRSWKPTGTHQATGNRFPPGTELERRGRRIVPGRERVLFETQDGAPLSPWLDEQGRVLDDLVVDLAVEPGNGLLAFVNGHGEVCLGPLADPFARPLRTGIMCDSRGRDGAFFERGPEGQILVTDAAGQDWVLGSAGQVFERISSEIAEGVRGLLGQTDRWRFHRRRDGPVLGESVFLESWPEPQTQQLDSLGFPVDRCTGILSNGISLAISGQWGVRWFSGNGLEPVRWRDGLDLDLRGGSLGHFRGRKQDLRWIRGDRLARFADGVWQVSGERPDELRELLFEDHRWRWTRRKTDDRLTVYLKDARKTIPERDGGQVFLHGRFVWDQVLSLMLGESGEDLLFETPVGIRRWTRPGELLFVEGVTAPASNPRRLPRRYGIDLFLCSEVVVDEDSVRLVRGVLEN